MSVSVIGSACEYVICAPGFCLCDVHNPPPLPTSFPPLSPHLLRLTQNTWGRLSYVHRVFFFPGHTRQCYFSHANWSIPSEQRGIPNGDSAKLASQSAKPSIHHLNDEIWTGDWISLSFGGFTRFVPKSLPTINHVKQICRLTTAWSLWIAVVLVLSVSSSQTLLTLI